MRNVAKTSQQGRKQIVPQSDLRTSEVEQIINNMLNGENVGIQIIVDAITTAFYFGYAVGRRAKRG